MCVCSYVVMCLCMWCGVLSELSIYGKTKGQERTRTTKNEEERRRVKKKNEASKKRIRKKKNEEERRRTKKKDEEKIRKNPDDECVLGVVGVVGMGVWLRVGGEALGGRYVEWV